MDIGTILVPFDFGEPSRHALAWARDLGDRFGASLHLLHVVPNPYTPNAFMPLAPDLPGAYALPPGLTDELLKQAEDHLDAVLPTAERQAQRVRAFVRSGDPRSQILDHAAREGVDLIVMGTHGRTGAAHLFLGSVAERVVRAASCPVLTVR
jgi:nucleotide-binding universal stress UspA family protein